MTDRIESQGQTGEAEIGAIVGKGPIVSASPRRPSNTIYDRITVIETVYYQESGESPEEIVTTFSRDLASENQQIFIRRCKATHDWQFLDLGWLKSTSVGMILIRNTGGKRKANVGIPTEKQVADTKKKILEIRAKGSEESLLVHPNESLRMTPMNADKWEIRGLACEFTIFVYPV